MGYLYKLDAATDFAEAEILKRWLTLAEYQELGYTWFTKETLYDKIQRV